MSALGDPFSMSQNTYTAEAGTGGFHITVQRTAPGKWRGSCWRTPSFVPRWDWWIDAETVADAFDQCRALAEQAVAR